MVEALQAARRSSSAEARACYERLARTFAIQVYKAENMPAVASPETARLRPARLAA
jgi:hypothetical protein